MDKPWSEFLLDVLEWGERTQPQSKTLRQLADEAPLFGVDGYPVDLVAE